MSLREARELMTSTSGPGSGAVGDIHAFIDDLQDVQELLHYSSSFVVFVPLLILTLICCLLSCWQFAKFEFDHECDVSPSITDETHEKHGFKDKMGCFSLSRYVCRISWDLVGGACQLASFCCCTCFLFLLLIFCAMPPAWNAPPWLQYCVLGWAIAIPLAFLSKLAAALFIAKVYKPAEENYKQSRARLDHFEDTVERRMKKMEQALDKWEQLKEFPKEVWQEVAEKTTSAEHALETVENAVVAAVESEQQAVTKFC